MNMNNEKGQVVIEYVLMLTVIITLATTAFGILKDKFNAKDPNQCGKGTINPLCYMQTIGFRADPGYGFKQFALIGGKSKKK